MDILTSAAGTFGQQAVSRQDIAAGFDYDAKRKNSVAVWRGPPDDICVSNRPDNYTQASCNSVSAVLQQSFLRREGQVQTRAEMIRRRSEGGE